MERSDIARPKVCPQGGRGGGQQTPMRYLDPGRGKTGNGYLWTYLDPQSGTVCYDWQLGRGHECLLDFLGYDADSDTILFRGLLQCDGYSAYLALVKRFGTIRLGACLAHIRRKFKEAIEQAPEVVQPILLIMQRLYRIEKWLREGDTATSDCRLLVRRTQSKPLVDQLKDLIDAERAAHLPHSKLGEAITYALGQWQQFERYLDDGRIEIDNNLCYAARGITGIMPPPDLCRAHKLEAHIPFVCHSIPYSHAA